MKGYKLDAIWYKLACIVWHTYKQVNRLDVHDKFE